MDPCDYHMNIQGVERCLNHEHRLATTCLRKRIEELEDRVDLPRTDPEGCYATPDGECHGCPHCPCCVKSYEKLEKECRERAEGKRAMLEVATKLDMAIKAYQKFVEENK